MKLYFLLLIFVFLGTSCVQKTYKKTIVFTLNTNGFENIEKVGIRGNDAPLSWDSDYEMQPIKDSLYQAAVTIETGYKVAKVKFAINDTFELENENNREITLSEKDTIFYEATFNVPKK